MRGKFMGKTDLFLGKVEGIADGHAIIDAWAVEYLGKLLARGVQDLVVITNTDHMHSTRIFKDLSSRLRVTAGHED
jgi:hypothetical protein